MREGQAVTGDREDPARTELASSSQPLEIACDESGYEGEKLIGSTTDVFAHGSVRLDTESATDCMRELRRRIRSPATEYKANHLLREKNRSVLTWLLGPSGPLHGNAHVYLVDKTFFVVGKVIDLLVEEVTHTASMGLYQDRRAKAMAVTLCREGRRAFDPERWQAFLVSSNNLMRAKYRLDAQTSMDSFFGMVDVLRSAGVRGPADEILRLLRQARPHAGALRARLLDDPKMMPVLDPLIPGIVRAVGYWSQGGRSVSIVHDRQKALSDERIAQLKELFGKPNAALVGDAPRGRLAGLALVNSSSDSRVQIADILGGAVRKIASDELNEQGDAQLTALLRPYVDSFSIWGDDRSWSLLSPTSSAHSG
jgi:hypothetical protein